MRHIFFVAALCCVGCLSPVSEDGGVGGGQAAGGGNGGAGGGGAVGGGGGTGGGVGGSGGSGGGIAACGCEDDSKCSQGSVCESDPNLLCPNQKISKRCVVGCRQDSNCHPNEFCSLGILCEGEPCAPGACQPRCIDSDGDGYTARCDALSVCPGKQSCDCNDSKSLVNPGARENCSNNIDDDCDGLIDAVDASCQKTCAFARPACASNWGCQLGVETCSNACCVACPAFAAQNCPPNQIVVPGGLNGATGCPNPPRCVVDSVVCPAVSQPVCGVDYATYGNICELNKSTTLLHDGACLPGEGLNCNVALETSECGASGNFYCRDTCPVCGTEQFRCTMVGACEYDLDCYGQARPNMCHSDGGVHDGGWNLVAKCDKHVCKYSCL